MRIAIICDGFMQSSFEITKEESLKLSENSIERVINSAIEVAKSCPNKNELSFVVEEDLTELKRLMVRLWYSAQQAVFAAANNIKG